MARVELAGEGKLDNIFTHFVSEVFTVLVFRHVQAETGVYYGILKGGKQACRVLVMGEDDGGSKGGSTGNIRERSWDNKVREGKGNGEGRKRK